MQETQPGGGAPTAGPGWTGGALKKGRGLSAGLASIAFALAFVFEVAASVVLFGANSGTTMMPGESTFHLWAWQYDYGAVVTEYSHAPLLVFILAIIGMIAAGGTENRANVVRKAKGRAMATKWSFPEERARLRHDMAEPGYGALVKRGFRVRLWISAMAALGLVGMGLMGPTQAGFTAGIGPTAVLVAGGVALASVLLARPWEEVTTVIVAPDGALVLGGAGMPLIPATLVNTAPAAPATTPSPDWYPDPVGHHQLRYWDGARWTSRVSDDGMVGEDAVAPAA